MVMHDLSSGSKVCEYLTIFVGQRGVHRLLMDLQLRRQGPGFMAVGTTTCTIKHYGFNRHTVRTRTLVFYTGRVLIYRVSYRAIACVQSMHQNECYQRVSSIYRYRYGHFFSDIYSLGRR